MAPPRVALVFPARIRPGAFFGYVLPALGLERLGAAVEDVADVELFDARFETDLVGAVAASRPDIVAISVKTTLTSRFSYEFARELRPLLPRARFIMGGLHASACAEEALQHADVVVCGEGEAAFRRLVLGDAPADIPGVAFKDQNGQVVRNHLAGPLAELDQLKPPARHLRKPGYRYAAAGLIKMDLLETSRGCTHACSFCSPGAVYPGRYRFHSAAYVLEEVRRLAAAGVRYVMLTDDHFGGDDARTAELCDAIVAEGIRMAFFCFTRPFAGNLELKRKMVAAGFVLLSYGAESPAKTQLNRYGKGYPAAFEFIRQVNREWLEAGACYVGNSYVFGDPKDSAEALAEFGAYARRLDSTYVEPLFAQPYPGTRYREELQREGLLLERGWESFTEARLLVNHPELDEERMRALRARMWLQFFSPRKAAGVVRVPLYMHRHLGLPALTVLRYMKACDYSLFGCVLEDKPYADRQVAMVAEWFRVHLPTFEPEELELDFQAAAFDEFAAMVRAGWLLRLAGDREVVVQVHDGRTPCAALVVRLEGGRVAGARVVVGAPPSREGSGRRWTFDLPLGLLARFLGSRREVVKVLAALAMAANVLLLDAPRRLAALLRAPHAAPQDSRRDAPPGGAP